MACSRRGLRRRGPRRGAAAAPLGAASHGGDTPGPRGAAADCGAAGGRRAKPCLPRRSLGEPMKNGDFHGVSHERCGFSIVKMGIYHSFSMKNGDTRPGND